MVLCFTAIKNFATSLFSLLYFSVIGALKERRKQNFYIYSHVSSTILTCAYCGVFRFGNKHFLHVICGAHRLNMIPRAGQGLTASQIYFMNQCVWDRISMQKCSMVAKSGRLKYFVLGTLFQAACQFGRPLKTTSMSLASLLLRRTEPSPSICEGFLERKKIFKNVANLAEVNNRGCHLLSQHT